MQIYLNEYGNTNIYQNHYKWLYYYYRHVSVVYYLFCFSRYELVLVYSTVLTKVIYGGFSYSIDWIVV